MAITWNIDEARRTIREQMAEAARLDATIDDLSAETSAAIARAEAAEAALALAQQERDSLRAAYETAFNEGYRLSNNLHIAEAEIAHLREQAAALRALIAQAVQADLDDDAFALEAAIVRMADALDDNGQDAR